MHFDWTVNIGNVFTLIGVAVLAIVAWKDLTWRLKNLEAWRLEHMIDACSRDDILKKLNEIIARWDQREKDRDDFNQRPRRGE